jgi:hypothetical protein
MVPEVFWQQICYEIPVSSILRSILQQPLPLHRIAGGFQKIVLIGESAPIQSRFQFCQYTSSNFALRVCLGYFASHTNDKPQTILKIKLLRLLGLQAS